MKFDSKSHMVQELIAGKQFESSSGAIICYNAAFSNPFRYDEDAMLSIWDAYDEDIWTEVKQHHVHQDLIDNYRKGQAWQYKPAGKELYTDCIVSGIWVEPVWAEDTVYRLHQHNDLIQAHRKGAEIQVYDQGEWVNVFNISWHEDTQYRIKPATSTVYEWIYKSKYDNKWLVEDTLMSEKEAKDRFRKREYRKTGRSWEV
jgi:hypothetical protein